MITAHLLTKNNAATIEKTLLSVSPHVDQILVADLGSTDHTIEICSAYKADIIEVRGRRDLARNKLLSQSTTWNLLIEPWEVLVEPPSTNRKPGAFYGKIIQNRSITQEVRLWNGNYIFEGPVFEKLKIDAKEHCDLVLYSSGRNDYQELLTEIDSWKMEQPYNPAPHYYESCALLALGKLDEFLKSSEYYMHLENDKKSMSATMNRYYFAMVQLIHRKSYKPVLQNINLCLCVRPLMAEFWCLIGDVYYHLFSKFEHAKEFYKNAIILGSRRKPDTWPIDLAKYKSYPTKMINSCDALCQGNTFATIPLPDGSPPP